MIRFTVPAAFALLLAACSAPPAEPAKAAATDFKVRFSTSVGDVVVRVVPDWAPLGSARFRTLVETNYYDGARFFRVLPGFVAQVGIAGDPKVTKIWEGTEIKDDP